jgi:hypothetical protein
MKVVVSEDTGHISCDGWYCMYFHNDFGVVHVWGSVINESCREIHIRDGESLSFYRTTGVPSGMSFRRTMTEVRAEESSRSAERSQKRNKK